MYVSSVSAVHHKKAVVILLNEGRCADLVKRNN
jgi:hypothetical protein